MTQNILMLCTAGYCHEMHHVILPALQRTIKNPIPHAISDWTHRVWSFQSEMLEFLPASPTDGVTVGTTKQISLVPSP